MWVKICGTTNLADAQLAIASGADAVGFVFAPSKRQVQPAQVTEITSRLPETIEKVGVFVASDAHSIADTACLCGLTAVQLHRAYEADFVSALRALLSSETKLIQVIQCSVEEFHEPALRQQLEAAIHDENLWGILLDASTKGSSGGTGTSFDWKRAATVLAKEWPQRTSGQGPKLILAGGLRPENVREAIAILRPFGVDAVSGIEAAPGIKDAERVHGFVHSARAS